MPPPPAPSDADVKKAHETLFAAGLQTRYAVAGAPYVDAALEKATPFSQPMQDLVTESCWGSVWTRPGLEKKTRSLLNISMLCALNRSTELGVHVRGAVRNGVSQPRCSRRSRAWRRVDTVNGTHGVTSEEHCMRVERVSVGADKALGDRSRDQRNSSASQHILWHACRH